MALAEADPQVFYNTYRYWPQGYTAPITYTRDLYPVVKAPPMERKKVEQPAVTYTYPVYKGPVTYGVYGAYRYSFPTYGGHYLHKREADSDDAQADAASQAVANEVWKYVSTNTGGYYGGYYGPYAYGVRAPYGTTATVASAYPYAY